MLKSTIKKIPPHLPAVTLLGLVTQIGQVLVLRELLMVFHGNEMTIGIILASWMLWVAVGCRLGTCLIARSRHPDILSLSSAVAILVTLPATLIVIRGLRGLFDIIPGAMLSLPDMLISSFILMAPLGIVIGAQFIFLARLWRENIPDQGMKGAGNTYIWEALGNLAGGVIFTFFMLHVLNSMQSALYTGAAMLAGAVLLFFSLRQRQPLYSAVLLAALLFVCWLSWPRLEKLDFWAYQTQWNHFAPEFELLEIHQSKHGTISVAHREGQFSFFQSGHLVFSTAGPEAKTPGFEEQQGANFVHLTMTQHSQPENVLLIGGGWRGTLGEIILHPIQQLDYVELDERLTEAALPYLSIATREAIKDPRVRLLHTDGRSFIQRTEEKYDLIIIDVPDPKTAVLNRYYTREFFRQAKERLTSNGVLALSVASAPDLRERALANRKATIFHTLDQEFNLVLAAGERDLTFFASDSKEQISVDPAILADRYQERRIESTNFGAGHYRTLLRDQHTRRVNWILRHHGRSAAAHLEKPPAAPISPGSINEQEKETKALPPVEKRYFINSDFRPIGYYYTLMYWEKAGRGTPGQTFGKMLTINYPLWGGTLFVLCLTGAGGCVLLSKKRKLQTDLRFALLLAVFTTGLSTMIMQVSLIFAFQSVYGFIYEMVGMIVAMFMGGLAAGTYSAQRWIKEKANISNLAKVQAMLVVFAGILAFLLPAAPRLQSPGLIFAVFSALTFVAGFCNGLDFPLVASSLCRLNQSADKSAGTIYSLELLGACVGAVLASAVLAPIYGITISCLTAGAANLAALSALLLSLWREKT